MALQNALRGEAVLYVDTSNAFSPQRIAGLFRLLPDNGVRLSSVQILRQPESASAYAPWDLNYSTYNFDTL